MKINFKQDSGSSNQRMKVDALQTSWNQLLNKVPEVTIFFWIIKVLCTTVGETFADFLNFNLGFGLSLTTITMGFIFFITLYFQFRASKYVPGLYWLTVVLISVFGTLVTDNLTDNVGIPLEVSSIVFALLLGITFLIWYRSEHTLSIHTIHTTKREIFYWLTILFTFALGTAVGDLYSEQLGLGYLGTGTAVVAIIAIIYFAWKYFRMDEILSFWIVYILTRPLGASLGDYLSQPQINGGLNLGTTITSIIFLIAILTIVFYLGITKYDMLTKNEPAVTRGRLRASIQTIVALVFFLLVGIGGYAGLNNRISSLTDTSQSTLSGMLNDFITIESAMLDQVNANDFSSTKNEATELEHGWDISAPKLRRIDDKTWTQIDKTIDVVLASIRSGSPNADKCKTDLRISLDALQKANR